MTGRKDLCPVLVLAGEGGSLSLVKQQLPDGLFALTTQEIDYGLEDAEATEEPLLQWCTWEQVLASLESYPWRSLTPIMMSAGCADMLQAAYRGRPVPSRAGDRWGRLFAQSTSILAIERNLHELMRTRADNFIDEHEVVLPGLTAPADATDDQEWFPIPGMYGGFSYGWAGQSSEPMLVVESWSRVVGGSGQRHHITAAGCTLVEEGFV
ncbi:hypothetical protein [uncultured Luteimonas sp.]|uniref:hypothetical protein n=1 Tax=uncultured Luteimonas sp. TaxID=453144 RepID=UPI00261D701D|nr:hypothetical protein [uncultured Luteimonas sp.]